MDTYLAGVSLADDGTDRLRKNRRNESCMDIRKMHKLAHLPAVFWDLVLDVSCKCLPSYRSACLVYRLLGTAAIEFGISRRDMELNDNFLSTYISIACR